MIGVNRLDLKKLNPDYCKEHLDALKRKYNAALNSEEFVNFLPFRTLLVQILIAGLTAQDVAKVEKKINDYHSQIVGHEREIEKTELILRSIDVKDIVKQDYQIYSNPQLNFFRERQAQVEVQVKKLQVKLANFDQEFFAGL